MTQYSGKIIRKTPVVPTQASASGVWTVDDAAAAVRSNTWPVAGVPDPISRSVRLRSSATAYFSKTFAAVSNQQTATWSGWVKRGKLGGTDQTLFGAWTNTSNYFVGYFASTDTLRFVSVVGGSTVMNATTSAVFRDPSAWYHVVFKLDTTNATAANRAQVWVNGVLQTVSGTNPSLNASLLSYVTQGIGYDVGGDYVDGYMAEVNFVDGQALNPSSFGTTDAFTGAWVPMAYTGTYGTNGFYLNFKDNTSTTTLGYDYSGNSNNWTANNISLTAGTTYDSMLDVPTPWIGYNTDGGVSVTRGNYCTLNPLDKTSTVTLTDGNLSYSCASGSQGRATLGSPTTGLWYFEHTITSSIGLYTPIIVGGCTNTTAVTNLNNEALVLFFYTDSATWQVRKAVSGSATDINVSGTSYPVLGNTLQIAYDPTNGKAWLGKNNSWIDSSGGITGNPSAGTNPTFTFTAGQSLFPSLFNVGAAYSGTLNCGQQPFTYTPPTGFKALCTTNLPEPTIKLGASYFAASTYTGNGTTNAITNGGNNTTATTFQPDFVWMKSRTSAYYHGLYDSVRGTGTSKSLYSNTTEAEGTNSVNQNLVSFDTSGFTLGATSSDNAINASGGSLIAWQWKAGGSAVSNTNGTITSQVNAGTTQGFSVVTYTGSGSAATVGHGLGVAPKFIIVKDRNRATDWSCLAMAANNGAGYLGWIRLNTTNAWSTTALLWNSTAPTSSVFSIGTYDYVNYSGSNYVAYCFSEVAGYSKFGSYTGNGSTDGPFVYCGFRPRYVMIKSTATANSWHITDTSRSTYNQAVETVWANESSAESTSSTQAIDILSNGFKIRNSTSEVNNSGTSLIYMAFAENPFKYSNAR